MVSQFFFYKLETDGFSLDNQRKKIDSNDIPKVINLFNSLGVMPIEEYQSDIDNAVLFIEGKKEKIIKTLTEPMQIAADELDYEKAAKLRDQIRSVREIQEKQYAGGKVNDVDIVVCAKNNNQACIQLSFIRSGLNLGSRKYYPRHIEEQSESDLIQAFLSQFYLNNKKLKKYPAEILISHDINEKTLVETVIYEKFKQNIKIKQE